MLRTLRQAWKTGDLKKRLIYTLMIIIIFRLGSIIPVPFLDVDILKEAMKVRSGGSALLMYFDTLSGGAFAQATMFALSVQPNIKDIVLVVRDFTKLFITPDAYADFTRRGGTIQVLQRSHLTAVCLNPTSPQGYTLNSEEACKQLSDALQCPVYDVVKCGI